MIINYNYLYQYLEKEEISIDKKEFEFQVKSHPDYPSLLAIVDTLSFFNIDNGAIHLEVSDIELLPSRFIAFLKEEIDNGQLYFVEKREDYYVCIKDKITSIVSKREIATKWQGIVLLVEKKEIKTTNSKNKSIWIIPLFFLTTLILLLFLSEGNLQVKLFFLLPAIGLLFSFAALKDLFGTKSQLLNSFCNITNSTNCNDIVNSTKWKFFKIINFSDLGIVFFTTQFLGYLIAMISENAISFLIIQKTLLIMSVPLLFLSLYYQKYVEKKWCPICLSIIAIILLEIIYLNNFQNTFFSLSTKGFIVFGFGFLTAVIIWLALKNLLKNLKDLKEYQLKSIRFERNYTILKNSLFAKEKVQLPHSPIVLGNKNSNTKITIITNPFCSHCKDVHEIMDSILIKHSNDVKIEVILKVNLELENEERKNLYRNLMGIYEKVGENVFTQALKKWFDNKNLKEWFNLFPINTTIEYDSIFITHNKWCEENEYNFTPTIFINGYEYPHYFDRKNIYFYINEIIEDSF